jgi:WD40 repeat protein
VDNAVAVSITEGVDITSLYFLDVESWELQKLFSVNKNKVAPIEWLSSENLLYTAAYMRYIWNMSSGERDAIDKDNYPYPLGTSAPSEWDLYGCYFRYYLSPNRTTLARHYNLTNYYYALHEDVDGVCEVPAENPPQSGLDLHFYDTNTTLHIDIYNHFVHYLAWSPSAEQLLIVTDSDPESMRVEHEELGGVYIYNVAQDQLERLNGFFSPFAFRLTWSPDSQWLAGGFTDQGLSAYRLSDGKVVPLDEERFLGTPQGDIIVMVHWSPVMDYSETQCSAGE